MKQLQLERILLLVLTLVSISLLADVAVLYSGFSGNEKRFIGEFDKALNTIGLKAVKYENTKLAELTKDLSKYEMVLVTSCGNFENTVDLKPYADAWRDYLSNGGMLFVADANYTSVLDEFVNRLGPEFELAPAHCIAYTKPSPENAKAVFNGPKSIDRSLVGFPTYPMFELLEQGHWGHLTPKQAETWNIITTCVEGNALTLEKHYGKGIVFVTVHSNLSAGTAVDFARKIITNMRVQHRLQEHGLRISGYSYGLTHKDKLTHIIAEDISAPTMSVSLTTKGKTDSLTFSVKHTGKSGMVEAPVTKKVHGDHNVTFTAQLDYKTRGTIKIEVALKDGSDTVLDYSLQTELPQIITSKLRRKHFYPGMNWLEAWVDVASDHPQAGPLTIQWRFDGMPVTDPPKETVNRTAFRIPISGLALGRHVIEWNLLQNSESLAKLEQEFFIHPEPTMRFRDDGTLLNNGKPFFPFGMYHVSWDYPPELRFAMVKEIAQYGYNVIHTRVLAKEKDTDTYRRFLDECQKHGIYVITEFDYPPLEAIQKYKDHPAVLGWNPGDEPYPKGTTPEEMFARYDSFKKLDPNHIAYTVICTPSQYKNYASGTDVLAPDPYPIPNNPIDTLYKNYTASHSEARKYDTALWAVPQCFGYDKGKWTSRAPTADEYRSMLYLALMAGAKGFVNYTYYDSGFFLPKSPELWNACKTVPTEMKPLIPFILEGTRAVLLEDEKGIYAGTWTLGNRTALVIVNASPEKTLPFILKGDYSGTTTHFGSVQELKATSEGISGFIRPYGQAVLFK